jgi:GAF domain-containing protein
LDLGLLLRTLDCIKDRSRIITSPKVDIHMEDLDKTQPLEPSLAKTAKLPRLPIAKSEADFCAGQSQILEMVAANAPLSDILNRLVLLIEAQSPEMLCSVLLLSDDGEHVRHGAAPNLPEEYVKAIDGAPIGPKKGSCGTAMFRGEPVIVRDVWVDPLWEEYRGLAHVSGLRACWSTPIMSGRGKVLGSFAMYYREPRLPNEEETGLTEVATRIASLAIEHQLAREILARTQTELSRANEAATSGQTAVSIAHDVNLQLKAILSKVDLGIQLLNEDQPDFARLRETLNRISIDARHALQFTSSIQPSTKK